MLGFFARCTMKLIRCILLTCIGGLLPTAAVGQTIVWTDISAGRIQRKNVTSGKVRTIVQFQSPQAASQIHYDPITAKFYYRSGSFQRANVDGSDPENISTPSVGNFTLNVESRKLYWISPGNVLNRAELNGAGVESHTYASGSLKTLEAVGDDLFFGAGGLMRKGIWRAAADGSNEQFLHDTSEPFDLAYDPIENKLYCGAIDSIYRMNLDGTGFEVVARLQRHADQVVVDSRSRKLYWADHQTKVIQRSNLDGSNVEDFVTAGDVGNPNFIPAGLTIVDTWPINGACCDLLTGECEDQVSQLDCEATHQKLTPSRPCEEIDCVADTGACCSHDPFLPCGDNTIFSDCQCATCTWSKLKGCADLDCPPAPIPSVSEWGLTVLTLLLMIGAKIAFARSEPLSRATHGG